VESPDEPISFIKVKREFPLNGVARKSMGKGFEIKARQNVIRELKRIQNPPKKQCQNVIAQIVGWENIDPIHKSERMMG
jgi:hypothetical protein